MSTLAKLDAYSERGRKLLRTDNTDLAHAEFGEWVSAVARWLKKTLPDTGAVAEWLSQGESPLGVVDGMYDDVMVIHFRKIVGHRLKWLSVLPSRIKSPSHSNATSSAKPHKERASEIPYVDLNRIGELRILMHVKFDVTKLVKLCEELNLCRNVDCYFAMIMLTRSIIDHVPPVFGCSIFTEVANNYSGSRSFRESMRHLDNSSRKIADQHLHSQIGKTEVLPNLTQINFANDLDVLLAEIVKVLKSVKS